MVAGKKVLVVDDQKNFRDAVAFEMELLGFEVTTAEDGAQAFDKLKASDFDLIISDIKMPNWTGAKLLEEFRGLFPVKPPFILMTGFADLKAYTAFDMGADAFLGKPLNPENLEKTIKLLFKPLDEQLAQKIDGPIKRNFTGNPTDLKIGRRGLSFSEAGDLADIKTGDLVAFDISGSAAFPNIKGAGTLRWAQLNGDHSATVVGVEILHLEAPAPDVFARYVTDNKLVPVIPQGIDVTPATTEAG